MKKLFIFGVIAASFASCASSFQDSYTDGNTSKLNNRNVSQLSGRYKMFAVKEYDDKGAATYIKSDKKRYALPNQIENKLPNVTTLKDVEKILRGLDLESVEWTKNDEVEVKVNNGYISFTLLKNNKPEKTYTYKTKLKDGFLYLPKEENCVKVPWVIDGCVKSEKRIGQDRDGGLLIHEVNKITTETGYMATFLKYYGDQKNIVYTFDKTK